ncbi:MAG: glycosyltransferase family 9 protein [Lentisphaeria bacterium]|nr:glycosyltransferase family 9 protein [Lentisphaeria bacterium]
MKRYLIVKPSSLGDILHAMPAVSALAKACPDASVDWVVKPAFADLPPYLPCVRRVIPFRDGRLRKPLQFLPEFFHLCSDLRRKPYDAVIDLQGLVRSAVIGRLTGCELRCGPATPRERPASKFYTRHLNGHEHPGHAVEINNAMMKSFLGREDLDFSLDLPVNVQSAARAREIVAAAFGGSLPERFAVVAPGARWATKKWPADFFFAVILSLARRDPGLKFLLAGTRDEAEDANEILSKSRGLPVASACGQTGVGELLEAIRLSSLMICNDSGPMHIAAALGVPVAAMFGPTDPALTGPYCEKKSVFIPEIACNRCFLRYCKDSLCHASVDPEAVAEASFKLLTERN